MITKFNLLYILLDILHIKPLQKNSLSWSEILNMDPGGLYGHSIPLIDYTVGFSVIDVGINITKHTTKHIVDNYGQECAYGRGANMLYKATLKAEPFTPSALIKHGLCVAGNKIIAYSKKPYSKEAFVQSLNISPSQGGYLVLFCVVGCGLFYAYSSIKENNNDNQSEI